MSLSSQRIILIFADASSAIQAGDKCEIIACTFFPRCSESLVRFLLPPSPSVCRADFSGPFLSLHTATNPVSDY